MVYAHSSVENEAPLLDITHLVTTGDKNDEYLIVCSSEYINLMCYCSHRFKEA